MNAKERLYAYCQLRLHGYSIAETKKIMADIDRKMKALEGEINDSERINKRTREI